MSDKTKRLKLETPVAGTFGWHVEWGRNMETLDNHPGILICTSTTRPENPWQGQAIFETDTENMFVFDGATWRQVRLIKDHGFTPPGGFEPMMRISGRYYSSHMLTGELYTTIVSANTLYFYPFMVTRVEDFDRIGLAITEGSPGFFRLAIYDSDDDFFPKSLLLLTNKAATDNVADVFWPISLTLSPGLYWSALVTDTTPRFLGFGSMYAYPIFGSNNISGLNGNMLSMTCDIDNVPVTIDKGQLEIGTGHIAIKLRKA